jgi:hypothetical protein
VWLGIGVVVLLVFAATGRRPALAGMADPQPEPDPEPEPADPA